jgi:uncharacterized protein (DUF736 family)
MKVQKKFDDTDRGCLFRDERKSKPEDRDFSGQINVGGREYWISAWSKTSKAGKKYLSLSVKAKNEAKPKPDFDDAIEF